MLRVPWILILNVFINVFDSVNTSEFPSFFDQDDLKEMGVRGHKSTYIPAPVTGRYNDRPSGYVFADSDQYRQKIPPNGLPIHPLPKYLAKRPPIKQAGRAGFEVEQRITDEEGESPFPPSDGRGYGDDDTFNLNELPKRLTETNKWDEFKELMEEEGDRQQGKVMTDWEDDAHKWAAYSRNLMERGKKEKQKIAARTKQWQPSPLTYQPSLGHEAYWGDEAIPKPKPIPGQSHIEDPSLRSPWNEMGQLVSFKRRQMNNPYNMQNPAVYNDNMQGSMERYNQMPPMYFKDPNKPEEDGVPNRQALDRLAQMDYPDFLKNGGDMAQYLPPYPNHNLRSGPEMVSAEEFSPNLLVNLKQTAGKIPGPGSEGDYPNGYRPYGSQPQMSSRMSPGGPRGGYSNNDERVPRPQGQYPAAKPALRKGGEYSVSHNPGSGLPEDYADAYSSLLRMGGMPSQSQGGPGPGSEGAYPDSFRSSMGRENMGRPSIQMGAGPLPGGMYPKNFRQAGPNERPGANPTALRQGGGYPSMDYPGPGMGAGNYPDATSPLRMGAMPGDIKSPPGPGSEGDFPEGFHPNMAGANMGLPPPPKELGPLPGRGHGRPPRGMQKGPPPEEMEEAAPMRGEAGGMPDGPSPTGFSPRGPIGMPGSQGKNSQAIRFPGGPPMREPGESLEDYIGPNAPQFPPGYGPGNPNQMRQGPPSRNTRIPTGYELMMIAKKKIAASNRMDELTDDSARGNGTTTPRPLTKEEILNGLPQLDDFHAPIRWVKFNSADTRDGLARVTDRKTHQNQQYVIEGELYVPIIDESMSRLGWTTEDPLAFTTESIVIPPNDSVLKVVLRSMNLNTTDEREWLAYETILGAKKQHEKQCDEQSCQARCHKTGCDAVCKGDTCATGCVAVSCNAVCKGPGCFSMCIGDHCTAKCEGLNCESRCWGKSCESDCHSFSCQKSVNGVENRANATWDQMYPQYDMRANPDVYTKQDQRIEIAPEPGGDDYYD